MFGLFARKGPFSVTLKPGGEVFEVKAGDNLLKAALDAGLAWPHNCRVGSCGECRSRLLSGKIKPLNDFSYVLSREELDDGMILACQTCLRSDVDVEVALSTGPQLSQSRSVPGRIAGCRHLTHDIVEIEIDLDAPLPSYLAGQYADLSIPGVVEQPRSYSFARAPVNEDDRRATFFIRKVPGGLLTTWLHDGDRTGTAVMVNGPFGTFYLRESQKPILCMAGGSGLAPIKALIEQISDEGFHRDVVFIFGARTRDDLYCLEEIRWHEAAGKGKFIFRPVLSAEPEDSDWTGPRGNCTDLVSEAVPDVAGYEAYLCGPPGMVDSALDVLTRAGVSRECIYYDKFLDASHMPGGRA